MDLLKLREALDGGNIEWERHVLERMFQRSILREEVIEALKTGECIEDYPEDRPFPSALFLGWHRERALHVVVALDDAASKIFIVTVYQPDLRYFEPDLRTRRRK